MARVAALKAGSQPTILRDAENSKQTFPRSQTTDPKSLDAKLATVGDRVTISSGGGLSGTVRFDGPTDFSSGEWLGIELDVPDGKNDGSVKGKRYFDCKPGHGIFVRPINVFKLIESSPVNGSGVRRPHTITFSNHFASEIPDETEAHDIRKRPVTTSLSKDLLQRLSNGSLSSTQSLSSGHDDGLKADFDEQSQQSDTAHAPIPLKALAASPSFPSRKKSSGGSRLKLQLAEAIEDHNLEELRKLISKASDLSGLEDEFSAARTLLQFEANAGKDIVARFQSVVGELRDLASSMEICVQHMLSGSSSLLQEREDAIILRLGSKLEERLLGVVEQHVEHIVEGAVSKATKEMVTAINDVQHLMSSASSSQGKDDHMLEAQTESNGFQLNGLKPIRRQLSPTRFNETEEVLNIDEGEKEDIDDETSVMIFDERFSEGSTRFRSTTSNMSEIFRGRESYLSTPRGSLQDYQLSGAPLQQDEFIHTIAQADVDLQAIHKAKHRMMVARMEAAAHIYKVTAKMQAMVRGKLVRKQMALKNQSAIVLQTAWRMRRKHRQRHSFSSSVNEVRSVQRRHKVWARHFESVAGVGKSNLSTPEAFSVAIRKTYHRIVPSQAELIWHHHVRTSKGGVMDLRDFIAISEKVIEGDAAAACLAGLSAEEYSSKRVRQNNLRSSAYVDGDTPAP